MSKSGGDFMVGNANLDAAKAAKNDEFYTQWNDIENEMQAYLEYDPDVFRGKTVLLPCDDPEWSNFTKYFALNFDTLGIEKLISTSYATQGNGRILVMDKGSKSDCSIVWDYLDGDGDFRSGEVTALRDEADMVITNPPFSLFREFMAWLVESSVRFAVLGNQNAVTYKDIFPLVQGNKVWWGTDCVRWFNSPSGELVEGARSRWYTNLDHGRHHESLDLMTMNENLKLSRHKEIQQHGYPKYVNIDGIHIANTNAIPGDYPGLMGVPVTFLDKYNPEQFEIVANGDDRDSCIEAGVGPLGHDFIENYRAEGGTGHYSAAMRSLGLVVPKHRIAFKRLLIRHLNPVAK